VSKKKPIPHPAVRTKKYKFVKKNYETRLGEAAHACNQFQLLGRWRSGSKKLARSYLNQ
jgi:hypothetical protein